MWSTPIRLLTCRLIDHAASADAEGNHHRETDKLQAHRTIPPSPLPGIERPLPTVSIILEPVEFVYVRDLVRSRGPEDIISSVQVSLQQKLERTGGMTSTVMITLDTLELGYLTALVRVHTPDTGVSGIHDSIAQKLLVASAAFL